MMKREPREPPRRLAQRIERTLRFGAAAFLAAGLALSLGLSCGRGRETSPQRGSAGARPSTNGWSPKWRIGDWWIVKFRGAYLPFHGPDSPEEYWRVRPAKFMYRVTGIKRVRGRDCFVLEERIMPFRDDAVSFKYLVRCDSLQVISVIDSVVKRNGRSDVHADDVRRQALGPYTSAHPPMYVFPAFPLVSEGEGAESLAKCHLGPVSYVSQTVARVKVSDVTELLKEADSFPPVGDSGYLVRLLIWASPMADSYHVSSETQDLWLPNLPWFLCSSLPGRTVDGVYHHGFYRWLADCSSWHPKGYLPDTLSY